ARGYLNDVRQTAARFVPDPFFGDPGTRMYATGDIARWRRDGSLEFVGRRDRQIKLHGYRIELDEIEEVLSAAPQVSAAAVLLQQERLVAYVRGTGWAIAEVTAHALQRLPAYMIPSAWIAVDEFPTTVSGKIDRARLAEHQLPAARRTLQDADQPRSRAGRILAAIWREQRGLADVGVHENYFELAGDSVLGIRILSRARRAGLNLSPRQLFEHPTIAGLAAAARWDAAAAPPLESAPLSPIQ